jgi:hypothetical protein
MGLGRFGELSQGQAGFLTAKCDVGTDPHRDLLVGGAVDAGRLEGLLDCLILICAWRLTGGTAVPRPLVNRSRGPTAIAKRLSTLPESVDRGRDGTR